MSNEKHDTRTTADGSPRCAPVAGSVGSGDYEARLAEWKIKHGYRDLDPDAEEDEALRAADKQLKGEDYCVICGNGPQPISGMCLITRRDDPYVQPEEDDEDEAGQPDNRVRACPKCWAVEYGDEDELSDEDDSQNAAVRHAEHGAKHAP